MSEKIPQTFDGETGRPNPEDESGKGGRKIRLSNIKEVRAEMARIYRRIDNDEMDSSEGNKRVWLLRQIGDLIAIADMEARIDALEALRPREVERIGRMLN